MRILVVGAGGVGSAVVPIAARRGFFETMVVADYDRGRAERAIAPFADDGRFVAAQVDASSADAVAALCRDHGVRELWSAPPRDPSSRQRYDAGKGNRDAL